MRQRQASKQTNEQAHTGSSKRTSKPTSARTDASLGSVTLTVGHESGYPTCHDRPSVGAEVSNRSFGRKACWVLQVLPGTHGTSANKHAAAKRKALKRKLRCGISACSSGHLPQQTCGAACAMRAPSSPHPSTRLLRGSARTPHAPGPRALRPNFGFGFSGAVLNALIWP